MRFRESRRPRRERSEPSLEEGGHLGKTLGGRVPDLSEALLDIAAQGNVFGHRVASRMDRFASQPRVMQNRAALYYLRRLTIGLMNKAKVGRAPTGCSEHVALVGERDLREMAFKSIVERMHYPFPSGRCLFL